MLRRHTNPITLAFLTLAAAACQDSFTAPPPGGAPPPSASANGVPHYCSIRISTPGHIQEFQRALNFPSDAAALGGAVMVYRYRQQPKTGSMTYSADCVIPRSMAALEHVNQYFKVPPELRSPKGKDKQGNEMTTQGCVLDGVCELEPIVVSPPAIIDPEDGGGGGGWTGGGGGSNGPGGTWQGGGGGGGGGGDDGEESGGSGGSTATDTLPACTRDAYGNCVVEKPLSNTQWNTLMSTINKIKTSPDYCMGAKQEMQALASQSLFDMDRRDRFRVWDGYSDLNGTRTYAQVLSDQYGNYVVFDPRYVGSVITAAHEGLHVYMNNHPDNSGLVGSSNTEPWIDAHDIDCVP